MNTQSNSNAGSGCSSHDLFSVFGRRVNELLLTLGATGVSANEIEALAREVMADEKPPLEKHLENLVDKLGEVRRELADGDLNFRIVPLSHQDSGVTLAVCESIGADLIPLTPWHGSLFLDRHQLYQLRDAMAEFHPLSENDERRHLYQRGCTSITV